MAIHPIRTAQTPAAAGLAQVHQFPSRGQISRRTPRYFTEVQVLDLEGSRHLLGVTKDLINRSQSLVEYVDRNREEARLSGVETIAIELSAILEGGRLSSVRDALEDAVQTNEHPAISIEGFSKLRRAEFLVSEVDQAIARHAERPTNPQLGWAPMPYQPGLGQVSLSQIPTSLLILGVIGAGAILTVIILALTRK